MKQNQEALQGKDTVAQGSFYEPVTCASLIEHNPLEATNIDKRFMHMWWGKGGFHWEVAKLIIPIWW